MFLFGCVVQTQETQLPMVKTSIPTPIVTYTAVVTPRPSATSGTTEVFLTATSIPIETKPFHFGATPQMSQVGGISGIFYREDESDEVCAQNYSVFRFYDDGVVMEAAICDDDPAGDFLDNVWPDLSTWFHREDNDALASRGIYRIVEDKIWFTTTAIYPSHTVIIDYFGTFSKDQLVLNSFSHPTGFQGPNAREEVIITFDLCSCP